MTEETEFDRLEITRVVSQSRPGGAWSYAIRARQWVLVAGVGQWVETNWMTPEEATAAGLDWPAIVGEVAALAIATDAASQAARAVAEQQAADLQEECEQLRSIVATLQLQLDKALRRTAN